MKMSLSEYLSLVYANDIHLLRSWRLQCFAIKEKYLEDPYFPFPHEDGIAFYTEDSTLILLENVPKVQALKPILPTYTEFQLNPDHFNYVKKAEVTLIGISIMNHIAFHEFDGMYTYINKTLSPRDLIVDFTRDITAGLNDDDYNHKFFRAISDLEAILASDSEFMLRSIVEGQLKVDKAKIALRKKLVAENKDRLDDPLISAMIEDEIAKASAKHYKDIGATIWTGGKSHKVTLMKTEGNYGSEATITGGRSKYITKSLKEGIEIDNLGVHVEVARYGSFGRGAMTALGGAGVDNAYTALESRRSSYPDCKTKAGAPKRIREHNYTLFEGQCMAGSTTPMTKAMLKLHIGKTIRIRVPSRCNAERDDVCHACAGSYIARIPESIPTKASGLMSTVMNIAMQATHGISSQINTIDFFDDIY